MTNTPSPTDEDRELIEACRTCGVVYATCRRSADRLESLLSDRAKLEEALRGIACAIRLGAETDMLAWANLARACQQTATDALNRSTDRAT